MDSDRTFGPALADQEQANFFQQVHGLVHSLWQKDIGLGVALVNFYAAGDKHGWRLRGNVFDFFDEAGTIQTGHDQVRQEQVHTAAAKSFERGFAVVTREHAIAAGFEHDFANGKGLFVVINAEDRFLGLHCSNRETVVATFFFENRSEMNPKQKLIFAKVARSPMALKWIER